MSGSKNKPLNQVASDQSIARIKELLTEGMLQQDIINALNSEGFKTIREKAWTAVNLRQVLWKLRWREATWYGVSARRAGFDIAKEAFLC
ncbi:MAG: recombinase family protein [Pseudomonadota bacterium]